MPVSRKFGCAVIALLGSCATEITSAQIASPATLPKILAAVRPGSTIQLSPGKYAAIAITRRRFDPPINIVGKSGVIVSGIDVMQSTGVHIERLSVVAGERRYGVNIQRSSDVRLSDSDISGGDRGIVVGLSHNVLVANNKIHDIQSDGIDFSGTLINIHANEISRLHPAPADHPDCIQGMAVADQTTNISIKANRCFADAQGIFLQSATGPGFDDVVIEGNILVIGAPNGIYISPGNKVIVTGNSLRNFGKRWPSGQVVKSQVVLKGEKIIACGNKVNDFPLDPSTRPCSSKR